VDWEAYIRDAERDYAGARTLEDLAEVNVTYQGRKSPLKLQLREVRDRETGQLLNGVRARLEELESEAASRVGAVSLESALQDRVDVTLPGTPHPRGHLHLITQIRREVEDIFLGMGYEIVDGREVETSHYLFDALNMAPNHITRSPLHSFYIGEDTLLRTETSPSQIHTMESKPPPVYMVSLGRTYRRDTADATHSPFFHQVEGLAVDRGITLGDLKGTLLQLLRALFGEDRRARFTTDFFPFTEPSLQVAVSCFRCDGAGCQLCKHSGWIEIGGSGMVDPNVLRFVGYDPEEVSGFAFGWGLERMAILRHELPDIRDLWTDDLRFLRQF